MTRDEILSMAREAGLLTVTVSKAVGEIRKDRIVNFANLVTATERTARIEAQQRLADMQELAAKSGLAHRKAEPVAWMWRVADSDWQLESTCPPERPLAIVEPLYTGYMADAYIGAREEVEIWKRRALEAEEKLRAESAVSSRLVSELNAENGPTHMGEPVQQRQPLTPLTPGQRVDIADVAAKMEFSDNFLSDICKIVEMVEVANGIGEKP